jgi:Ca-activated chloride channel homolog
MKRARAAALLALAAAFGVLPFMLFQSSWSLGDLELTRPRALAMLALVPLVALISTRSLAALSVPRRRVAAALRACLFVLLSLALARPTTRAPARRSSTVLIADVSASMDDSALAQISSYVRRAQAARGDHHLALITFARDARRQALPASGPLLRHPDALASDVERAVTLALGLLVPEAQPRIVLFSDLRETHGSLARLLPELVARGAPLHVWTPAPSAQKEVAIRDLTAPPELRAGEPFELRAALVASLPSRVRVRLEREGVLEPDGERMETLASGETTLKFRSVARATGVARYALTIEPLDGDGFVENNRFERALTVRGAPRVLYLESRRDRARAFAGLLRAGGFAVDVREGRDAPRSEGELESYAFCVVSDVAAAELALAAQRAIARYVAQGGGFLMAGGERSFGPGGYVGSALEPLLPLSLSGSLRRDEPTVALVLALDKSGSMAGEKLERAKEAALATADQLGPSNYLGVIGFDAEPMRVVRLAVGGQRTSLAPRVSTLTAGGGTALFPALDAAYQDLGGVRARVKHVVLLTDGQSQEEALDELVRSMRADGITVSAIGLGDDVNRGLLESVARAGGGRAYFTRDPARVPRLFTEEAEVVAASPLEERRVFAQQVAPVPFLRGIDVASAPPLGGYVATRARAAPAELVLITSRGDPLLARMRVGLGWSLAFTSDVSGRWSAEWYGWRSLSTLFAQLVREHMRRDERSALPIHATLEGDTLHATVDVLDDDPRFVNGLTGTLNVRRGDLLERVAFTQSAPGRYEATLPLSALGAYALDAELSGEARSVIARGEVSRPFPSEVAPSTRDDAALAAQLRSYGALSAPAPERLFELRESRPRARSEHWPALVWLALALFVLDLAARRLPPRSRREKPAT